jgi:hypothetical protein
MPKIKKANPKALRKAAEKARNIQLAVEAYKDPTSGLSLRAAASLYHCNKDSITHHLNDTPEHRYAPNVYIDRQRLSPAEKTALVNHIRECYQSMLPVDRGAPGPPKRPTHKGGCGVATHHQNLYAGQINHHHQQGKFAAHHCLIIICS